MAPAPRIRKISKLSGDGVRAYSVAGVKVGYDAEVDSFGIFTKSGDFKPVSKYSKQIPKGARAAVRARAQKDIAAEVRKASRKVIKTSSFDKYGHYAGGGVAGVAYRFGKGSKIMPAAKGYQAVRMRGGELGWIKEGGDIFISDRSMQMSLRGVDTATGSDLYEAAWIAMSPAQKARFMERAGEIDWNDIWKTKYRPETGLLEQEGIDIVDDIIAYALEVD